MMNYKFLSDCVSVALFNCLLGVLENGRSQGLFQIKSQGKSLMTVYNNFIEGISKVTSELHNSGSKKEKQTTTKTQVCL